MVVEKKTGNSLRDIIVIILPFSRKWGKKLLEKMSLPLGQLLVMASVMGPVFHRLQS